MVARTPSILSNGGSMHQKQPPAKVALAAPGGTSTFVASSLAQAGAEIRATLSSSNAAAEADQPAQRFSLRTIRTLPRRYAAANDGGWFGPRRRPHRDTAAGTSPSIIFYVPNEETDW